MSNIFKWLWDKAEKHGEQKVIAQLHALAEYHQLKSQIAYLQEKYEPDSPKYDNEMFMMPKLTPQEHSAISSKVFDFISKYHEQEKNND